MGIALSSGRNEEKFDRAVVILHAKFAEAECTTEREKGEATVSRLSTLPFSFFAFRRKSELPIDRYRANSTRAPYVGQGRGNHNVSF
jgi:hypothetical protein